MFQRKIDIVDDLFEKVEELEGKLNEQIEKNVELKTNLKESTKESLINDVCVDLADTQNKKFQICLKVLSLKMKNNSKLN